MALPATLAASALLLLGSSVANATAPQAGAPSPAHATDSRSRVQETTYTVTPKAQRTVRFTGYATYTFKAPAGRRIVEASARIVGAQAHAVKITGRTIATGHASFTVTLVFPGEQGKPGKLVVRLLTIA